MVTQLRTVETDIHFGKIVRANYHTYEPKKIRGAKVIEQSDSGLCLVEFPAVAVRLDTSRAGDGFLDGIFRLDEADKWEDGIDISCFDGGYIKSINSLYQPDYFVTWNAGLEHHRKVLNEIVERFARYSPRIVRTKYW